MSSNTPPTEDNALDCPPCKLLQNSGMLIAKVEVFMRGLKYLRSQGKDIPPDSYEKAIKVICGADDEMDDVLPLVVRGPFVDQS